jgi:hypothetical protein
MYTEEIYIEFINEDIQRRIKTRLSISSIENNKTIEKYVKLNIRGLLAEEPAS